MHHTGKKESKKEILKNRYLLQGDSSPDPQNPLELRVYASIHWSTSVNTDNSGLKEVYIPPLWWLKVSKDDFFVFFFFFISVWNWIFNWSKLNVKVTINPYSFRLGPCRGTFKEFMNNQSRGYRLNRMTVRFSPCSKGVFLSVGENINTTLFIIISIVLG